jgi:hypothetical protein
MHEDLVDDQETSTARAKSAPAPQATWAQRLAAIRPVVVEIGTATSVAVKVVKLAAVAELRMALSKVEADEKVTISSHDATKSLDPEVSEDFRCSMSGVAFDHSESVIIGFGVNVKYRGQDGSIESITTDLSPISMEIFVKGRIRKSALGAPMTHYFPFAINEEHWERAKRVLTGSVNAILGSAPEASTLPTEQDKLLFVVGELWKSMAVLMMKAEAHASEKILKGFCSFHHLLLLAAGERDPVLDQSPLLKPSISSSVNPDTLQHEWNTVVNKKRPTTKMAAGAEKDECGSPLLRIVNHKVRGFATNPRMRHKSQCPDFGRFLPMILLSNVTWNDVKMPFLMELLTRNAKWIYESSRSLGTVRSSEARVLSGRAEQSWEPSATGLKLTAFQVRFCLSVAQWARSALPADVVRAYEKGGKPHLMVRTMYNALGGRPTANMLRLFQAETKRIEAMRGFDAFFREMAMPRSEMEIQAMLCDAMRASAQCKYHRAF